MHMSSACQHDGSRLWFDDLVRFNRGDVDTAAVQDEDIRKVENLFSVQTCTASGWAALCKAGPENPTRSYASMPKLWMILGNCKNSVSRSIASSNPKSLRSPPFSGALG